MIKGAREAAGLSRAELAHQAGINPLYMDKLEQGARHPSPSKLAALARVVQVSAGELMTRAALLEASTAPTNDELLRRLLRAASTGAGVQAALRLVSVATPMASILAVKIPRRSFPPALQPAAALASGSVIAIAAGSLVEEYIQHRRRRTATQTSEPQEDDGAPEVVNPREELLEHIAALSDDEIEAILLLARDAATDDSR
ncbi:putative HTH cro/C1-type domain-containing protein [Frankia sp. AiPs1]